MSERRIVTMEVVTLAAFCAFLFYFGLSAFGLAGADEPRYAQIAHEMLERRDLVTPTLYGKPWLEKPPFYYWRAMAAYRLFGVHDWTARLPSATAATFMVAVIYFFLRRFRLGAPLNGALMTAASVGTIGFARGAGTDMQLAAAFTIGILAWFAWYAGRQRRWLLAFYFFMALGALAKGPVAPLLAGLVIVIFALARREARTIARTLWWPGILLFLVVALPWYVAVQLQNPQFVREFILQHNLGRFTSNMYHHKRPFWYFIPVLLTGVMPWMPLVVGGWMETIRDWKLATDKREDALDKFLFIWTAAIVVFFSLSQSKLPGYILPGIPPCTILAAIWVAERERLGWAAIISQGVLSGILLGLALLYPSMLVYGHAIPLQTRMMAGGAAAIVFVATVGALARKGMAVLRLVVLTPVIVGLAFLLRPPFAPAIDNALSERPVAREIEQILRRSAQVTVFMASREVEYGLAFYLNHTVSRYGRDGIPAEDHLVVAPAGSGDGLTKLVHPRRVSRVGSFAPQRLEFFWISPPPTSMEHHH